MWRLCFGTLADVPVRRWLAAWDFYTSLSRRRKVSGRVLLRVL